MARETLALDILPDRLHLLASAPPPWSPNRLAARCQGASSRILRQAFPILRRTPARRTRSFFVAPAGHVAADAIRRQVDAQSARDA